jgi:hypothetical protein
MYTEPVGWGELVNPNNQPLRARKASEDVGVRFTHRQPTIELSTSQKKSKSTAMILLWNFSLPLFYFVILSLQVSSSIARETAQAAAFTLSFTEPVDIELKGYAGLAEKNLFSP